LEWTGLMVWPPKRTLPTIVGGVCSFLLAVLCAPEKSQAGCGDQPYFFVHNHSVTVRSSPLTSSPPTPTGMNLPVPVKPLVPATPCSGPECSRGHVPPLIPLSVPVPVGEQWACLLPAGALWPHRSPQWLQDQDLRPLSPLVSSIYRPPRFSASLHIVRPEWLPTPHR
jgi:hypothetical protein